ncbi:MAG TPA: GNAT family N-acetyltransferase [Paraburkholderia sp.]|jgi:GNAT superfamily N-acetyltransferase|nr:GNAT family N-acetyltransferase [Paraburkholderia sp.]
MTQLDTQAAAKPAATAGRPLPAGARAPVLVRVLTSGDRERLLSHFLSLGNEDRLLRFGQAAPDHVVEKYVRGIDFANDTVFGVFDHQLELVGVGHLAYLPADSKGRTAEFGVSVLESARGQGVGSTLFERAAIRCRNTHVTTLYIHFLSRNATMMRIARKSGMKIEYAYGEADAWLSLEPADHNSIVTELMQEQAAVFDYAMKRLARQGETLLKSVMAQPATV